MNEANWHLSNFVSQRWRQRLAGTSMVIFLLFVVVNVATLDRLPAESFLFPYLRAFLLGIPLWLLSVATWWRRKMTWWSWGLNAIAFLLDAILQCVISGIRPGGGTQADLGAGITILELHIYGIGLTVVAILLGWSIDWLLHRGNKHAVEQI